MKVNIFYASQKGSTAEIANRIVKLMDQSGTQVEAYNVAHPVDFDTCSDAIVILSPIYKSMWLPEMKRFVRQNSEQFGDTPIWLLNPCIRVMETNGLKYANENYIPDQYLNDLNVQDVYFFPGKLLKADITAEDMLTLSQRYDGEQLAQISGDYRDWEGLRQWTEDIILSVQRMRVRS